MSSELEIFIERERDYFQPMLDRARNVTLDEREEWALETVRQRHARISHEVFAACGGKVKYGPFKGMALSDETWWGSYDLGAQCLGIYEYEILLELSSLLQNQDRMFIDIGAADGYYAVGALFSGLCKEVVCFEQSGEGRATIKRNWEDNGARGSLIVAGEANDESLLALDNSVVKDAVVLIDIEGAEFDILSAAAIEKLRLSTIILEVHNWVEDFIVKYADLLRRLDPHFYIENISRKTIDHYSFPELRDMTDDNRALLSSERRPCAMRFLRLRPRVSV